MKDSVRGAIAMACAFLAAALLAPVRDASAAVPAQGDPVARRVTGPRDLFVRGVHVPLDQPGQKLTAFLTRIAIEVPNVGTLTPDNMPNSLVPSGSYEVVSCVP